MAQPTKGGLSSNQPKISYVQRHKQLGWIIGSGVYVDDIDSKVAEKRAALEGQLSRIVYTIWGLTVTIAAVAFWGLWILAKRISDPINRCAAFASELGDGNLDASVQIANQDEIGDLGASLSQMGATLQAIMVRIASTSHSLSDGAGAQAAALEETSSSLSEIAAMVQQNADNSAHADSLVKTVRDNVTTVQDAIADLTRSMVEITSASREIQKISIPLMR